MRCVYVGVFVCAHTGEGKKGGGEERKRGKRRDRELPDLKRQIRTSLKSITGEPCTDFISWQTCAAKRMQTDIDVWGWLISSSQKCTHWVAMQSLFWVCLRSILNTRLSVTFSFRKKTKHKLAFYSTDTNLLEADITGVENGLARSNDRHSQTPSAPLFATISRRIFLLQDLKINKQKWHSGLSHFKRVPLSQRWHYKIQLMQKSWGI